MSNSLKSLTEHLNSWEVFKDILSSLEQGERIWLRGVYRTGLGFLLAGIKKKLSTPMVVVVPNDEDARVLFNDMKEFLPERAFYLPSCDFLYESPESTAYEETLNERITSLYILTQTRTSPLVIVPLRSFLQRMVSLKDFNGSVINFKVGEHKRRKLMEGLARLGYERKDIVEQRGCWALRGSILDIFPNLYDDPLRIEFSNEKVESIRSFDPTTQKSIKRKKEAVILPRGNIFSDKKNSTILSYLSEDTIVCLQDSSELKERTDKLWEEEYKGFLDANFFKWAKVRKELSSKKVFFVSRLPQKPVSIYSREFSLPFQSLEGIGIGFNRVEERVKEWQGKDFSIYFVSYNMGEKERLKEILKEKGLYSHSNTYLKIGNIDSGFLLSPIETVVLADKEIFSRYRHRRPFHKFKGGQSISSLLDIKRGDYVVHLVHGIGRYLGLNEVKVSGKKKEFLMVEYEGNSLLYVPVEGLELLHKYIGFEGESPRLSRLGSSKWRYEKEKVSKACRDVAFELLNMEAVRKSEEGFAFSSDTHWQKEFETSFIYEETDGQLRAAQETKQDMEKPVPMDRLICGDAGYGKTEVAIRAAFKTVMDNKQVAVLAPTTILSQQHWLNFKDRLKDYPFRVEMLSRFVSRKEQRGIINDLKKGRVDILVGTHRILQNDVKFKDLGLMVVDEEQKFGVMHKEKLKLLRKTVDILTLTATPIPRTLYTALSGIRELSMINTPPRDRLAVKTIVAEFSDELIKEAVKNEIARGGQVFFLHNRIKDIAKITDFVKGLVPGARVEFAHGQMHERELEKIMLLFIDKKIDVLVTTTIIESGLDISNANTIIVNNAHRFGLADLYQLRGRVGRYKLQAYTYLLVPPRELLTSEAKRRLRALEEFSYLGSGFQLAMQDLEIRGAGNLLGREQHGHIMRVGFELYMKILKDTVDRLKGKKIVERASPVVNLDVPAYIPSNYVPDEPTKLSIYKRISEFNEEKELQEMRGELKDRFGEIPQPVELLLAFSRIRINARLAGIEHIVRKNDDIVISFLKDKDIKEKIRLLSPAFAKKLSVNLQNELVFSMQKYSGDYRGIAKKTAVLLQEFIQ